MRVDTQFLDKRQYMRAAHILQGGGTVVVPTETVYGIAADATNNIACDKIFLAKGRPSDNPLIVHLAHLRQLSHYATAIPHYVARLFRQCTPLTIILKKTSNICARATAGLPTVAIRIPAHPLMKKILRKTALPLAAPSANISGALSSTNATMALCALSGKVDAVVDGGTAPIGIESTIIAAHRNRIDIVRPGVVSAAMIRAALQDPIPVVETYHTHQRQITPGATYQHYRPQATLMLCARAPSQPPATEQTRAAAQGLFTILDQLLHSSTLPKSIALILYKNSFNRLDRDQRQHLSHYGTLMHVAHTKHTYSVVPPYTVNAAHERAQRSFSAGLTRTSLYIFTVAHNKDYAYHYYTICNFFDTQHVRLIIAEFPHIKDRYYNALCDRLQRAAGVR